MKIKNLYTSVLALSLLSIFNQSQAAIVASGNVDGLTTFQDTTTGLVWLRLDNFFNPVTATSTFTGNNMLSVANAAGFTEANNTSMTQLMADTSDMGSNWSTYANLMGYGQPRQLIWGIYTSNGDPSLQSWAYAYGPDSPYNTNGWVTSDSGYPMSDIAAGNSAGAQDLGLWAYKGSAAPVPEPTEGALLLSGIGLLGFIASRRKSA